MKCVDLDKQAQATERAKTPEGKEEPIAEFNFWADLRAYIKDECLDYLVGGKMYYEFDKEVYWEEFQKIL